MSTETASRAPHAPPSLGWLTNVSIFDSLQFAVSAFWNLTAVFPLLVSRRGSSLHKLVKAHPEILKYLVKPFVAANWDARTRLARIVDHCKTADAIGGILDVQLGIVVDLIRLDLIDPRYRITVDQQRWLLNEGLLVLSLWNDVDRIFQLGFCLSSLPDGHRVAYIGSIQGRREDDMLSRYREFTKAASGMRPRDFLVEVFKMLCRALDVVEIRAVSDANHCSRKPLRAAADNDAIKLPYDEIWRERGGANDGNGFFILPVAMIRRADNDIPAKKRQMYHKRYAMLAQVEAKLAAALKSEIAVFPPDVR